RQGAGSLWNRFHRQRDRHVPQNVEHKPWNGYLRHSKIQYNGNPEKFEAEYCPKQRALKGKVDGVDRIATYKQSINGQFKQSTSATYAQASPLYYEYSRYFNTTVDIPVAVIRTMDAQEHFRRVASKGHTIAQGKMIANGWNVVTSAEKNPTGY